MKQFELTNAPFEEDDVIVQGQYLLTGRPTTLREATETFVALEQVKKQTFITQGFILRVVKDDCLYQSAGYVDIYSYAKGELGIKDDSTVNRYININKRFSIGGYSAMIDDRYMNYKYSALSEIWKMTDEEIEQCGITETTTVAKIRDIKREKREEIHEVEEQIEGQTEITDFVPDSAAEHEIEQETDEQVETIEPVATSQKKSDWQNGIFENDHQSYGWQISTLVQELIERCWQIGKSPKDCKEIEEIEFRFGYCITFSNDYFVFRKKNNGYEFKVSTERIEAEYNDFVANREKEQQALEMVVSAEETENEPVEQDQEENLLETAKKQESEEEIEAEVLQKDPDLLHIDIDLEGYTSDLPNRIKEDLILMRIMEPFTHINTNNVKCFNFAVDLLHEMQTVRILMNKNRKEREQAEKEQEELPVLKNNDQRREWIEKYRDWPLWSENEKTKERFYRYEFENGAAFVVKDVFSDRERYDWEKRKMARITDWVMDKCYIIENQDDALNDCVASVSTMVDYLREMKKKGENHE